MKKILTCIIFCGLPLIASSEYIVKIPLETSNIILNVPSEIKGSANLNPSTINRGESSILSWSYDYANEVNIDGLGVYGKSGSINVSPLATKNYNVTAKYGSISKYENLLLTVIQPNSNIVFNADKLRIGIGQPVNLSWNVENADNINIDNGVGSNLPSSGDLDVYPTIDTTFTLSAKDYNNNDILSSVFVDVVNNTIINSFNASSLNITKGNSVVFNWDVTDSEGLNLNPYGSVSGIPTGSQSITFNTSGSFDFTL